MTFARDRCSTRRRVLAGAVRGVVAAGIAAPLARILAAPARGEPADGGRKIMQRDNVEFIAVEPSRSTDVSVVAQCLDNQWVPRPLLHRMLRDRLSLAAVEATRSRAVRTEYIRSLVNTQQVICNRAYLFNNPVVFNDYVTPGEDREAFKKLVGSGALVAYLFNEGSPLAQPHFGVDPTAFQAWRAVCEEVRMTCIRLSWDDDTNEKMSRERLAEPFNKFALFACKGNPARYARDLALAAPAAKSFAKRLGELSDKARALQDEQGKPVTREQLYREFVTAGEPAQRRYDADKPFAAEIKELIDLSYNSHLPDALSAYALTPHDSIPRTALQELELRTLQAEVLTPDELLRLLRNTAFALVGGSEYLESFRWLSLADVNTIRATDEWAAYMRALTALLADPTQFPDPDKGARGVLDRYATLARRIAAVAKGRLRAGVFRGWLPQVEIEINNLAGEIASLTWTHRKPDKPAYSLHAGAMTLAQDAAARATTVVVRLLIRGASEAAAQADLFWNVDLIQATLAGGLKEWEEVKAKLGENFAAAAPAPPADNATVNYRIELAG